MQFPKVQFLISVAGSEQLITAFASGIGLLRGRAAERKQREERKNEQGAVSHEALLSVTVGEDEDKEAPEAEGAEGDHHHGGPRAVEAPGHAPVH